MNFKIVGAFIVGGIAGASAMFVYLNKKFEKDLDREITEYKKMLALKECDSETSQNDEVQQDNDINNIKEEAKVLVKQCNYDQISNNIENKKEPVVSEEESYEEPTVITEDKYFSDTDDPDFPRVLLTLYSDMVLTDEHNQPVDSDEYIGQYAMDKGSLAFNEGLTLENDVIYIRNANMNTYFQVELSDYNYEPGYAI